MAGQLMRTAILSVLGIMGALGALVTVLAIFAADGQLIGAGIGAVVPVVLTGGLLWRIATKPATAAQPGDPAAA